MGHAAKLAGAIPRARTPIRPSDSAQRMRQAIGMNPSSRIRTVSRAVPLATQITVFALVALAATIVWVTVGRGDFWPMWVWLGIAIVLSLQLGIRWAWAQTPGRERQLALHGTLSAIVVAIDVAIWAMSGGGLFWPAFPLIALGGAFAVHATIRSPRHRDLAVRVEQLTRTRRGALDVQGAELRKIERDLHDGAQARLVALSIQLGRAEERLEDQPEAAELVRRAREEASAAIGELRDLARGIAPPVLADRGLGAAVQALADRSPVRVTVQAEVPRRLPPVVETAAYFVAAEALTNAAKHAPGATVRIAIRQTGRRLVVLLSDDGPGGANQNGGGLTGLRQRVEALDGRLEIDSPAGQGTAIRAELPCA
jgi:signal transduction histidine kinase